MYKVGTRVKKVRKNNMPSEIVPTGTEGIVVGLCSKYGFDCQVNYRGYGIKISFYVKMINYKLKYYFS